MAVRDVDFRFHLPTKIEFGYQKFNKLPEYAQQYGSKALIVSYKDLSLSVALEQCIFSLAEVGIQTERFEEVIENPTFDIIDRGAKLARESQCDLIIALGGGSVIDVSKGISVCAGEDRVSIWNIVQGGEIKNNPLPVIAIPTTSGTGSEVTQYAVISHREQKRKEGIGKPQFYPRLAICDPELTLSLPPMPTAVTGLDALSHAIEGYTTRFTNSLTDSLAETAIDLIARNIRTAVMSPMDRSARYAMMMGSMLAGIVITHTDTSLAHVMGEAMGAVFNISHGLSVALTLPAVIEYNLETNIDKYAKLAFLLGGDTRQLTLHAAARMAPGLYRKLLADLSMPHGLAVLGVSESPEVLRLCTRPGWDAANLRPAAEADFIDLIQASLSPQMSYWEIKK